MPTTTTATNNTAIISCPRCNGSGHYSFNLIDGTMCYRCRGAGRVKVNIAKQAQSRAAAAKRDEEESARRNTYIAAMAEVRKRFNAEFGFGITTERGLDLLNSAVFKKTGRDLQQHTQARL